MWIHPNTLLSPEAHIRFLHLGRPVWMTHTIDTHFILSNINVALNWKLTVWLLLLKYTLLLQHCCYTNLLFMLHLYIILIQNRTNLRNTLVSSLTAIKMCVGMWSFCSGLRRGMALQFIYNKHTKNIYIKCTRIIPMFSPHHVLQMADEVFTKLVPVMWYRACFHSKERRQYIECGSYLSISRHYYMSIYYYWPL